MLKVLCHTIFYCGPHFVGSIAVKVLQYSDITIKLYDGLGLGRIILQPFFYDFGFVIFSLTQRFAGYIVLTLQRNTITYLHFTRQICVWFIWFVIGASIRSDSLITLSGTFSNNNKYVLRLRRKEKKWVTWDELQINGAP